LNLFYFI
jgi:hypothetical protein